MYFRRSGGTHVMKRSCQEAIRVSQSFAEHRSPSIASVAWKAVQCCPLKLLWLLWRLEDPMMNQ